MPESEVRFNRIFIECVTHAFREVLGETPARILLYHVGYEVSATKADAFARRLEGILGAGANILERRVLESLYSRCGETFEEREGRTFTDYVNEAKKLAAKMNEKRSQK